MLLPQLSSASLRYGANKLAQPGFGIAPAQPKEHAATLAAGWLTSTGLKREHVGSTASEPRKGMHVWWNPSVS